MAAGWGATDARTGAPRGPLAAARSWVERVVRGAELGRRLARPSPNERPLQTNERGALGPLGPLGTRSALEGRGGRGGGRAADVGGRPTRAADAGGRRGVMVAQSRGAGQRAWR